MSEFLDAVVRHPFMRAALLMAVLSGVACGVVGTYVVTRRISYIAGAVAHCVLGGLGAARYCQVAYGWTWFHPLIGAALAALMAAAIIGLVSLRAREREDTIIGAIWSVGMAIGVLFIWKTPGYHEDLMSYLFGNILLVSPADLWLMGILDVLILGVGLLFYNQFLAVCFDEEFARLRGLHVEGYYLLLLAMTSLTVVVLLKVVGIILVIAMLTLPAAVAGFFSRTLFQMMVFATGLCILLTTGGLAASFGPSLPAGATTILLAAGLYLVVILGKAVLGLRRL